LALTNILLILSRVVRDVHNPILGAWAEVCHCIVTGSSHLNTERARGRG
jgi:hypothetical protein